MAMNLNGMTWEQLVALAKPARDAYIQDETSRRGEPNEAFMTNSLIDWNGSKAMLHLPTPTTTTWNGETDPSFNRWNNAQISYSDPEDDDYFFRLTRNADGTVGQQRMKDVADIGFAADMAKFISTAVGMYGVGNAIAGAVGATAGAAGSSGASAIGTSAAGAGEIGIADAVVGAAGSGAGELGIAETIGGAVAEGAAASGAGYVLPGYEAAAAAGAAAAGGGATSANVLTQFIDGAKNLTTSDLVKAGASIVNGVLTNRAADKAADAQKDAGQKAIEEAKRQSEQARADLAPWRNRGVQASNRLALMMGMAPDKATYGDADPTKDPLWNKGYRTAPKYQTRPTINALAQYVPFKRS